MSLLEMTVNWIDTVLNEAFGDEVAQVPGQDLWYLPGTMPRSVEVEGHADLITVEIAAAARHSVRRTKAVLEVLHDATLTHPIGDTVLFGDVAVARHRMHAHDADRPALQRTLDLVTAFSADLCAALGEVKGGGECAEDTWPGHAPGDDDEHHQPKAAMSHLDGPFVVNFPQAALAGGYL